MTRFPKPLIIPLVLAAVVAVLWAFPSLWYRDRGTGEMRWLQERTDVPDWGYRSIPVEESAEKVLVADRTVNGIYTNAAGGEVYAFFAKRFEEKSNEIGLFIHTPDRCWVETGWKIEPDAAPTFKQMNLHGVDVTLERRIFDYSGRRELVYFFGLQGGRPLPYRLDHYLETGLRTSQKTSAGGKRPVRASDLHFLERLWDSFTTRRDLRGPKQFIRVSTSVEGGDVSAADERLTHFLQSWLQPSDYSRERAEWQLAASRASKTEEAE